MRLLPLFLLLALPTQIRAQSPAVLTTLIQSLGSQEYATREAAQKQFSALSPSDFWALDQCTRTEQDPEINARLLTAVDTLASKALWLKASQPPPEFSAHIVGRLLNAAGQPIPNACVTATSASFGPTSFRLTTRTDTAGKFDLAVPFADITYTVAAEAFSYKPVSLSLSPQHPSLAEWKMTATAPIPRTLRGTLRDENNLRLPNLRFQILGQEMTLPATTNDAGEFECNYSVGYLGHAIVLAHTHELIAPIARLRDPLLLVKPAAPLDLALVKPAAVTGTVRDSAGPASNVAVLLRPTAISRYELRTQTNDKGEYRFADIPPGTFHITAGSPTHSSRNDKSPVPETTLSPGATQTVDITLNAVAPIYGNVLNDSDEPVRNALVSVLASWPEGDAASWHTTFTDADGRFLLQSARFDESPEVYAFSPAFGLGRVATLPLRPGKAQRLTIRLPGARRIAGTITDPKGNPIAGITCTINAKKDPVTRSADDGTFDLGQVTAFQIRDGKVETSFLMFQAPRPSAATADPLAFPRRDCVDVTDRETAPQFFQSRIVRVDTPDSTPLHVVLTPAQLLSFSGTARDADGTPLPDAELFLLSGEVEEKDWINLPHPHLIATRGFTSGYLIASAHADANGNFTFWALQSDSKRLNPDSSFAIGLYAKDRTTLIKELTGAQPDTRDIQLRLPRQEMTPPPQTTP